MPTGTGPRVNRIRCTRCGACVQVCEHHVLALHECAHVERPEECGLCGRCEEVCPEGALACEFTIVWGDAPENAHSAQGQRPVEGG